MNTLIVRDSLDKNDINFNDIYFDLNNFNYTLDGNNTILKECIKHIDECKYVEKTKRFIGKFTGETSLTNLSTGCKTAINVLYNTDKIVNVSECGTNALNFLMSHDGLVMSTNGWVEIENFKDKLTIRYKDKDYIINNEFEYLDWWGDFDDGLYK